MNGTEDPSDLDALGDAMAAMVKRMLKAYRRRPDFQEDVTMAVLLYGAHQDCQADGKSFRGWVRENTSISLPTAYRLVRIGRFFSAMLPASKDTDEQAV